MQPSVITSYSIHYTKLYDAPVLERLEVLRGSTYYRRLDETGRRRLHTLLPSLIEAVAGGGEEAVALGRVLHVLEAIGA